MNILWNLLALLAAIAVYEFLRFRVQRWLRRRLKASTKAFVRQNEIRLDRFKFTRRSFLKTELLADRVIMDAIAAQARSRGVPLHHVYGEVEEYLDEIIPGFNILSYYKVGLTLVRATVGMVYDVILDSERIKKESTRIPEDAVVIFLMNHRSNFDYLLVSLLLSRTIALSYAVGEWARIWPLEHLFRSFGSYFVRRGERDALYHVVLKRYVQLVSRYGITQGIFPEGGLTRDGLLRPPKLGLLQYIVELQCDPDFKRDIVLVPVAINYDRVLEDRVLVRESIGKVGPPTVFHKALSALRLLLTGPLVLLANLVRILLGRIKRHGYATASFGTPVSLRSFFSQRQVDFTALPEMGRREEVKTLADFVMDRIGDIIPVTPVPLVSCALLRLIPISPPGPAVSNGTGPRASVSRRTLEEEVHRLRLLLRERGARLVTGRRFEVLVQEGSQLEEEREMRSSPLLDMESEMVAWDITRETLSAGLELLEGRRLVRQSGGRVDFDPVERPILAYYANSLEPLTRTLPDPEGAGAPSDPPIPP